MRLFLTSITLGFALSFVAKNEPVLPSDFIEQKIGSISFTENKGQIHDQNNNLRPDVLFGGQSNGLVFHLRQCGISYQLSKIDKWKKQTNRTDLQGVQDKKKIEQCTVYRLDVNWLQSNPRSQLIKEEEYPGNSYYYTNNGNFTAKTYGKVTYINIYNGINLKWYQKNNGLEYDYLCAAGSDYKQIKLEIKGAEKISLNTKGELLFETPLGTIIEKAPHVTQGGKTLSSKWVLNGNVISFSIENLDKRLPYIIDPAVRAWGTYYGGSGTDEGTSTATDASSNVYLAGYSSQVTGTIIATVGSHQSTFGGGLIDAFLAKFNSAGVRQWATYYGGDDDDQGWSCAVDASGNVYLAGITSSTIGISTPGSHQQVSGIITGSVVPDGFLVKFNSSGVRQWATYYGGNSYDDAYACAVDASGNVYLSGSTETYTGSVIATTGSHQDVAGAGFGDAYLAKFNSAGVRQWATYYGGSGGEGSRACYTDALGNVYIAGNTSSTNSISTVGSHQPLSGGGFTEAFIAKFNSAGIRQWGSYYGGNGWDEGRGLTCDAAGNVYLAGYTDCTTSSVIATAGAHQTVNIGSGDDGFLVKFNPSGLRLWGTYYGGEAIDQAVACAVDATGNIYLVGATTSTFNNSIATAGSHQTNLGNNVSGFNGFLAKFNTVGIRQWGTYYGGNGDGGAGCATDASGNIYMTGSAITGTALIIATAGAHQNTLGGGTDAYLVKFIECGAAQTPTNTTPVANQTLCAGSTTTLNAAAGTSTVNWYATPSTTTALGSGTAFITPTLSAGTYTYYAEGADCALSATRTAITLTVLSVPVITVASGSICQGQSFTISPGGASSYTYSGGSAIVNPLTSTVYIVQGNNGNGCIASANCSVIVITSPTISLSSSNATICTGNSFTINAAGAANYTITDGVAINSSSLGALVVTPTLTTTYTVSGSVNGCLSVNSATCSITVGSVAPTISLSTNNATICPGTSFTIQASGANTYSITGGSFVVSPTVSTTYTISGFANGCASSNQPTINVAVTAASSPTITGIIPEYYALGPNATVTIPFNVLGKHGKLDITQKGLEYYNNNISQLVTGKDSKYTIEPDSSGGVLKYKLIITELDGSRDFTLTASNPQCPSGNTSSSFRIEYSTMFIPNFISPNDDGINDEWIVEIPENIRINAISVTDDKMKPLIWGGAMNIDGPSKSPLLRKELLKSASDGIYTYYLYCYVDDKPVNYTGILTIKRK